MSDPTKRKPDANATIQIDLDQVQLYDPNTPPPEGSAPGARQVPPPLPPSASLPGVAPAAPRSPAKTIAYVAMFVVLLGVAILGGLMVGTRARGTAQVAPAPSSAPAGAAAAATAAPAASSATRTLTLPTIEMR